MTALEHEPLTVLGFCYKSDESNNAERLLALTERRLEADTIPIVTQCLNTYVPLFTNQAYNAKLFIDAIETCLSKTNDAARIINDLDEKTILFIINTALLQAERYTPLIEQLLQSSHSQRCQFQLQARLKSLISIDTDAPINELTQLNTKHIEFCESRQLTVILTIQRLLYFAEPINELRPFISEQIDQYSKRSFCASASLFQTLLQLQKTTGLSMTPWFSWLTRFNQNTQNLYLDVMEEWHHSPESKEPSTLFHWLRWNAVLYSELYNDTRKGAKEFIRWLSTHSKEQLTSNKFLKNLLDHHTEKKQLHALFDYAVAHKTLLNQNQIIWLCEQGLHCLTEEPDLADYIIQLNSWKSVASLLHQNNHYTITLINKALSTPSYWEELASDEEAQSQFLKHIILCNFSAQLLLELIQKAVNQPIKSLLILVFLSQAHYLDSLQGSSILDRLSDNTIHQSSRLNALIQQMNPNFLSNEQIVQLPTETSLSILCCISHFHRLSESQVSLLLKKVLPAASIEHWLYHYANMPNAYYLLAHLMKIYQTHVYRAIRQFSARKQAWFINYIIEHLELFDAQCQLLQETEQETHLILALNKYLNGHQSSKYIEFINQLSERLLNKSHKFSLQATQLLITLHYDPRFKELNQRTAYLINYYLKIQAQAGSIDLFYESGIVNYSRMMQLIPLKPNIPEPNNNRGLFSHLLVPLLSPEESRVALPDRVHPLIDALSAASKQIKAFDYYVIHYKGCHQKLAHLLQDYLECYTKQATVEHKALYHLSTCMARHELEPSISKTIYEAFLNYPNLYDRHISYCLFLYNTKKTIQHFGLQGSKKAYQDLINLCSLALQKLDPQRHADLINMAKVARFEAGTELAFATQDNFFSRLFRRFRRCWIYGWTGFFVPNTPTYVASFTNKKTANQTSKSAEKLPNQSIVSPRDILTLLDELKTTITVQTLDELMQTLTSWLLKKPQPQDMKIRYALHRLYRSLLTTPQKEDYSLWLQKNQKPFIVNRFQLLECLLANNQQEEASSLLKEINEDSTHFHYLNQELLSDFPQSNAADSQEPKVETTTTTKMMLNTAASLVNSAWGWTSSLNFFGMISPTHSHAELPITSPTDPVTSPSSFNRM